MLLCHKGVARRDGTAEDVASVGMGHAACSLSAERAHQSLALRWEKPARGEFVAAYAVCTHMLLRVHKHERVHCSGPEHVGRECRAE